MIKDFENFCVWVASTIGAVLGVKALAMGTMALMQGMIAWFFGDTLYGFQGLLGYFGGLYVDMNIQHYCPPGTYLGAVYGCYCWSDIFFPWESLMYCAGNIIQFEVVFFCFRLALRIAPHVLPFLLAGL